MTFRTIQQQAIDRITGGHVMAENSNIKLATHTFNPWRENNGTRVVAAESAWKKPLKWNRDAGAAMDSWRACRAIIGDKGAGSPPERPRVFCASMADVFEDWQGPMLDSIKTRLFHRDNDFPKTGEPWMASTCGRPLTMADVRRRLFELIDATPNLDWLLLTKRPENIMRMMADVACSLDHYQTDSLQKAWQSRVWLGTALEAENAKLRAEVELVLLDDGTTVTRADAWKREYEKMRRERDDLREQLRMAVAEGEATS